MATLDDEPQQQIADVCDEWHNLYAQEEKLQTETQKPHAFTKLADSRERIDI
jgi:hypothetical protein